MSTKVFYEFEEVEGYWDFLVRLEPSLEMERHLRKSAVVQAYVNRNHLAKLASAKGKMDVPENYSEKYLDSILSVQQHEGKAPESMRSTWERQSNLHPAALPAVLEKFGLVNPMPTSKNTRTRRGKLETAPNDIVAAAPREPEVPQTTSNVAQQERPVSRQSEVKSPQKETKAEKVTSEVDPPVSPALLEIPVQNNALRERGLDVADDALVSVSLEEPMDIDESWFAASPEARRGDLHSLEKRMERLASKDSVDNSLVRKLSQLTLGDSANSSLLSSPGRRTFWEELDTSER